MTSFTIIAFTVSCSPGPGAAPPNPRPSAIVSGTAATAGPSGKGRHTMDIEQQPSSGCNFYSNGDILCAPNCTGSWHDGTPGTGATDTVCDTTWGRQGVTGPGPGIGGHMSVANPAGHAGFGFAGSPAVALTYAQRIYNALQSFKASHSANNSTLNYGGAPASNECVTTSQGVLAAAGLAAIANGTMAVDAFEAALPFSGYTQVSQANAQPGDIVIQSQDKHMGFCETNACGIMISNSSTPESFTWETSPAAFEASYHSGGTSRFYHHNP
ncbi:MAG TPA: hypothetical protein VFE35_00905 [Candidatus Cybelea sp.]|nr:hypothetical protein [Candidatus Cybelea sp.]